MPRIANKRRPEPPAPYEPVYRTPEKQRTKPKNYSPGPKPERNYDIEVMGSLKVRLFDLIN